MQVGSELEKINELHKNGVLTDNEFKIAKEKLLALISTDNTVGSGVHIMGKAAHKFVNFKIVVTAVGAVLFAILFFTFFLPRFQKMESEHEKFSQQVEADMQKHREKMNAMSKDFDKSYETTSNRIEQTRREIDRSMHRP